MAKLGQRKRPAHPSAPAPAPASAEFEELVRVTAGEYEILGQIGRGGMATVYLAHELALDRKVAVKVMSTTQTDPGLEERFRREAKTAAHLSHPNIIPIFAVRETAGLSFFVMRFVVGRTLREILDDEGSLAPPLVQAIIAQAGGALGYAHRAGVVHRDVKPANIMLDREGQVVVTDFGIAKDQAGQSLTQTGAAIGTPNYMSPEQCKGGTVTGGADQYALGIVAYQLLTGRLPFEVDNPLTVMWHHFNTPPTPILDVTPSCPPALAAVVMRMLEKEPGDRWITIDEAVATLGVPPLPYDDPVRQTMIALAKHGRSEDVLKAHQTPKSPVPSSKAGIPPPAAPARAKGGSGPPVWTNALTTRVSAAWRWLRGSGSALRAAGVAVGGRLTEIPWGSYAGRIQHTARSRIGRVHTLIPSRPWIRSRAWWAVPVAALAGVALWLGSTAREPTFESTAAAELAPLSTAPVPRLSPLDRLAHLPGGPRPGYARPPVYVPPTTAGADASAAPALPPSAEQSRRPPAGAAARAGVAVAIEPEPSTVEPGVTEPAPPPSPPPPVPVEEQVKQTVSRLVRALEARNLGLLLQIYPGMDQRTEQQWSETFATAGSMTAGIAMNPTTLVELEANVVSVQITGAIRWFDTQSGVDRDWPVNSTLLLRRTGAGWMIVDWP